MRLAQAPENKIESNNTARYTNQPTIHCIILLTLKCFVPVAAAASRQTQSSPADAQVQQPQPVRGPDRPEAAGQAEQDREGRRAEQGAVRADQPGARARQEHRRGQKEGGGVDRAREAAPGGAGQARGGGPHRGRTGRTEAHRGGAAGGGGTTRRGAPPG
uniref:(northern house mosquito) hypothetical protein n=1 Tax=Culex pipiens TaxID=7175 RepID=A0A8D8A083_CULPI